MTEALFALGVGKRIVGRTRYCTQPPRAVGRITKVGGTKKISIPLILDLHPDLVVAVREENTRENIEELRAAGIPVLVAAPEGIAEAITLLKELADLVEAPRTEAVLGPIERVHRRLQTRRLSSRHRVFVPIWKNPYMSVGSDTYVHNVLETCGGENVFGDSLRYPTVTLEEIEAAGPEVILLPDEPYPFSAEDLEEFYSLEIPATSEDRIHLVDGKLLTWYGPRMASSLTQLSALLNADRN